MRNFEELVKYMMGDSAQSFRVIGKVTLCFTPYPLFSVVSAK
jgi:hypothetical protein